ncbi:hypothetical protein [Natronorubrum thiooxidans]|uniref:Uncharacterized protein n=1 Tax=Natronorubrum thiooxidans TaxID=308853 RepID=A0A1N7GVV2_9EURY|nr:hypothetical protein [Natronorubrum thiooxidans]SIS16715.1 hypothetical protein SAMN05421752_11629 [Natronorubrum thiooxidans]
MPRIVRWEVLDVLITARIQQLEVLQLLNPFLGTVFGELLVQISVEWLELLFQLFP